ncbi:MAG: hypothetical protein NC925_01835 [Candidatus Omnitrophica bacterium]|nr:hypothetical protein [Candidatus Omnitrophota bacterium]MCM8831505.1 hypothetical protein [Candidatus Omnitrophota bacterium]
MKKILFFILISGLITVTAFGKEEKIFPVDIYADQINYLQETSKVIAKGNVKMTYKEITVFCDEAEYDAKNNIANLKGEIKIQKEETIVYTQDITYDFNTQNAKMLNIKMESPPLYGKADSADKIGDTKYLLHKSYVTTCNLEKPHYRLEAKNITVFPKIKVVAKNMLLKVGGVPVFYFPYYVHSLKDTSFPVQIVPGKNSKWGYYILSRYRYNLNDENRGKIIFDWYEDRGFGKGITHKFESKSAGKALLSYYNIEDSLYKLENRSYLFDEYPERQNLEEKYLENNRYRGQLSYDWQPSPDLSIKGEFNKFSDEFFNRDFFYREYEIQPHPYSYLAVDYTFPYSSISLFTQKRLNPFFQEVEYLPQLEYNVYKKNIGSSNFYFESKSSVGNLAYRYKYSNQDFDAFRIHSHNVLSYTDKIKWLYINPYVGSYTTFYSKNPFDKEDLWRIAAETGLSLSTKLYRTFDVNIDVAGLEIERLRHIVTPILAYSYIFPPTVAKNNIYQFDLIDDLSRNQKVIFTLENKFTAKNKKRIWDFLYFSPSVEYNLKEQGQGSYFKKITSDLEIYPKEGLSFSAESKYDCLDRALLELNVDATLADVKSKKYSASIGHRYLRNDSFQATSSFNYQITPKLQFKNYLRYEYKEKEFKEQQYALRADLHCWWLDLGLNIDKEKDFTFWFAFVLKDFPDIHIGFDKTFHGARDSY